MILGKLTSLFYAAAFLVSLDGDLEKVPSGDFFLVILDELSGRGGLEGTASLI